MNALKTHMLVVKCVSMIWALTAVIVIMDS